MNNAQLVATMVDTLVAKKGHAFTVGYLQQMLVGVLANSTMTKAEMKANIEDIKYVIDTYSKLEDNKITY